MARAAASRLAAAATSSSTLELFSRHLAAASSSAWGAPSRLPDPGRERKRSASWWCPSRSFHATRRVNARDYYDVLGVSSNASSSEIKKAYYAERAESGHTQLLGLLQNSNMLFSRSMARMKNWLRTRNFSIQTMY